MLVEAFAKKHDLCPAGHDMMAPFLKCEIREMWDSPPAGALRGTYYYWIASRAQYDPKTIVRCVVQCARDLPPLLPDPAAGSAILDTIEGWCRGSQSRDDARAAGKKALAKAEAANGDKRLYATWWGIYYVSKCVDATTNSPGASGAIARAVELGGKESSADAEARYANVLRSAITWSDMEFAVNQSVGRPSPLPRPATPDEVQEKTAQQLAEYKKALAGAEAARATLDGFCKEQQFSLDGVSRLLGSDGGDGIRGLVEAAVSKMNEVDNRPAGAASSSKSKAPKRGRMMV